MRKGLLALAAALMTATAAQAAHTSAGCGLGTMLFDGKEKKVHLVLAATTNGTFGNQTFGISSDTLGCTSSGVVKNDKKLDVYAEVNFERISRDMARGGGEYLGGLASLLGVRAESREAFYRWAQSRYERIIPSAQTTSADMLRNLRSELGSAS